MLEETQAEYKGLEEESALRAAPNQALLLFLSKDSLCDEENSVIEVAKLSKLKG